jgi:putative glutamine amidotransferase
MPPRIAIPMPHSTDRDYSERAIPQYEHAVTLAGGEPVRVDLGLTYSELQKIMERCDAILLPGSNADVDPSRFKQNRSTHTAAADPRRDEVDNLLLEDAYAHRKPILGICYGLQSLNVYRNGSLIQHIPEFLPEQTRDKVNHEAGKAVAVAHTVTIDSESTLGKIVTKSLPTSVAAGDESAGRATPESSGLIIPVNSSHHQSADSIGEGLRLVARCPDDGIAEGIEGTAPDHFVVAVQWHPERSVDDDASSLELFRALVSGVR